MRKDLDERHHRVGEPSFRAWLKGKVSGVVTTEVEEFLFFPVVPWF